MKDPEIPKIMPRIFENMNLNDVIVSAEMTQARDYLEENKIKNVIE